MMWDLIEKPDTSIAAKSDFIRTIYIYDYQPSYFQIHQHLINKFCGSLNCRNDNLHHACTSVWGHFGRMLDFCNQPIMQDARGNSVENPILSLIETVCIAWFTLEYFIRWHNIQEIAIWPKIFEINIFSRLAGSPEKIKFLKDGMNVIDVLAIMPFFVSLFFLRPASADDDISTSSTISTMIEEDDEGGVEDILQVFRIFKLARVLKLARHSPGLQVSSWRSNSRITSLLCFSGHCLHSAE